MPDAGDLKPLLEIFGSAQSLVVATPATAASDTLASALGLFIALKEAGKNVVMASLTKPSVGQAGLVGIDQVTDKLGNRNLVISFDYIQDAIEKVSYNVEGKKFNLVIQPKAGVKPLDPASVSYVYEGSDAQIVFVVGAKTLAELGNLYLTEKALFDQALVVNIDNQPGNSRYGQVNWVDSTTPSISQLVAGILQSLGVKLSTDAAANLMQGLEAATQNFQATGVGAETFEVAAMLLRAGAKRGGAPASEPAVVAPGVEPDWLKPPKVYRGSSEI